MNARLTYDRCPEEEFRKYCDGLYVGQLSEDERRTFYAMCEEGKAQSTYEGVGGLLGLAKVECF